MRRTRARVCAALAAAAAAAILAGCASASDQVRAKVEQFVHAVRTHDYRVICGQVLAPSLKARLEVYGLTCRQAMKIALADVHGARLAIGPVQVRGNHAAVDTITTAQGQGASLDAIELTRTSAGWRVVALGTPVAPPPARRHAGR
jgi:hypothetical protein